MKGLSVRGLKPNEDNRKLYPKKMKQAVFV